MSYPKIAFTDLGCVVINTGKQRITIKPSEFPLYNLLTINNVTYSLVRVIKEAEERLKHVNKK